MSTVTSSPAAMSPRDVDEPSAGSAASPESCSKPITNDDGEHKLQGSWCFWYDRKQSRALDAGSYQSNLHKLCTFDTVEGFWRHYLHLKRPSQLTRDTNLYLFREGSQPMWESSPNGGCWIIKIKKKYGVVGTMWQDLLFAAIGEAFEEPDVVGIALAIRNKQDLISVWNQDNTNEERRFAIGQKLKEILELDPSTLVEYKFHAHSLKDKSTFRNAKPYVFAVQQES